MNVHAMNKHMQPSCPNKEIMYNSIIIPYHFFSINEAIISDIIKNILFFSNHFIVLDDYDIVHINNSHETHLEIIPTPTKHFLFKYKNEKIISFYNYLFQQNTPVHFIRAVISSFSSLLNSFILLQNNGICFFHLTPKNIVYKEEKWILLNFELSLRTSKLNETYFTNILSKIHNYIHKPFEVHLLFYIIHNNISALSYSLIVEFVEEFVNSLYILSFFSESLQSSYKEKCIAFLKQFINIPKQELIRTLLNYYDKWDVYSLSILYFHIFINITKHFSLKDTVLHKISMLLMKNIVPDPNKRSTLALLSQEYENILYEMNWDFVKQLSSKNMEQLFHLLHS